MGATLLKIGDDYLHNRQVDYPLNPVGKFYTFFHGFCLRLYSGLYAGHYSLYLLSLLENLFQKYYTLQSHRDNFTWYCHFYLRRLSKSSLHRYVSSSFLETPILEVPQVGWLVGWSCRPDERCILRRHVYLWTCRRMKYTQVWKCAIPGLLFSCLDGALGAARTLWRFGQRPRSVRCPLRYDFANNRRR